MSRKCQVEGCPARLLTPRLCHVHTSIWEASSEAKDSLRRHEFVSTYATWLTRMNGQKTLATRGARGH